VLTYKSILVGIDPLQTVRAGSIKFKAPVEEAIKQALWLAEKSQAHLTFFAAMDVPEEDLYLSEDELGSVSGRLNQFGSEVLSELVQQAAARGISANSALAKGTGWVEIIHQVLRHGHDLVVVGGRDAGAVERWLFGSTARKLLHNCPCHVLVTRTGQPPTPQNILVASDFSAVTDEALRVGAQIGDASGAQVYLMHAVDFPLDRLWSTGMMDSSSQAYHKQLIGEAKKSLADQADRVLGHHRGGNLELHTTERAVIADSAILNFINYHHVDLLVMGTMARGGIPGVFIGNTAERLASSVHCSMLAIKPADFECPITLPLPAPKQSGPYL
jgi:universal stress protein E